MKWLVLVWALPAVALADSSRMADVASCGSPATLRAAIGDLRATFGSRYPAGSEFLRRRDTIEKQIQTGTDSSLAAFAQLQRDALVANPLVSGSPIVFVERQQYAPDHHNTGTDFQPGEVQPVFDRHCVRCHDYGQPAGERLNLAGDLGLVFNTSYLELHRKSARRWFADRPSGPKLLIKAVHDGPPEVLPAYAWGAHRSRLVDVLRAPHEDVKLDRESFDRIVTWIDMNGPAVVKRNCSAKPPRAGRYSPARTGLTSRAALCSDGVRERGIGWKPTCQ